mmetsp:Transcript_2232/g.4344  ORF Transcript_2232/g.4344 Transcript_2232/m.4344 type:complete len:228 (+) Transcript_2232:114-797(+)
MPGSQRVGLGVTSAGFHSGSVALANQKNAASWVFFRLVLKSYMALKNLAETNALPRSALSRALISLRRAASLASKRRPPPAAMCAVHTSTARAAHSALPPGTTSASVGKPTSLACAAVGTQASGPRIRWAVVSPMCSTKSADEHPSGGTPNLAKGSEKVAASDATMLSISVAVVTAAPSAGPLTAATIGFGKSMTVWKTFWLLSLRYATNLLGSIGFMTLLRSTPAE